MHARVLELPTTSLISQGDVAMAKAGLLGTIDVSEHVAETRKLFVRFVRKLVSGIVLHLALSECLVSLPVG
jgi:hypothetical protein